MNIELLRNIFNSDYFGNFIIHIKNKIKKLLEFESKFNIHLNISSFNMYDLYSYEKILQFANTLHIFTENLEHIFIYESSQLFSNLISMLNKSIGTNIDKKIKFFPKNEI